MEAGRKIDMGKLAEMDDEEIDLAAKTLGQQFAHRITKNQIRNIFEMVAGALKSNNPKRQLIFAKAKIAYQSRIRGSVPLVKVMLEAIDSVLKADDGKAMEALRFFNEALLGYHRYYEEQSRRR